MPTRRKLGLRGEVLLYIGFLWLLQALFVHLQPIPTTRGPALHELLPPLLREGGWVFTGLVGIASAFLRAPGKDRWGFGALIIMPAQRFFSWLFTGFGGTLGWIYPPVPAITCYGQALVWGTVALLIYRIGKSRQILIISPTDRFHGDAPTEAV